MSSSFEKLNNDCIQSIFSFLPTKELGTVAQVCKKCKEVSEKEEIWKALFLKTVGSLPENTLVTKNFCKDSFLFGGKISVLLEAKLEKTGQDHDRHQMHFTIALEERAHATVNDLLIKLIKQLFASKNIDISSEEVQKKYIYCFSAVTDYGQDFQSEFHKQLNEVTIKEYRDKYQSIFFWANPFSPFADEFPNISPNSPNLLSKAFSVFKKFFQN